MESKKSGLSLFILFAILLSMVHSAECYAAQEILISEIKQNPSKFYNLPVKIKGIVVKIDPSPTDLKSGFYILKDESEATIEVRTNDLPGTGKEFSVEGIVTLKPETQTPYVKEMSRGSGNLILYLVIGAAVVVLILIIILFYLFFKPAPKETVAAFSPAPEPTRPVRPGEFPPEAVKGTIKVPSVRAQLEVLDGPKKGEKYILRVENKIGRNEGDLALEDSTVSGDHARIMFMGQKYFLINKSATNPTLVNKAEVKGEYELKDGDEITMGGVRLKFNLL